MTWAVLSVASPVPQGPSLRVGKLYDNNKYIYLGRHDRLIRALSEGVVVKWTATADGPGLANSIPGRPIITCSVLRAVVSILRQGPFAV